MVPAGCSILGSNPVDISLSAHILKSVTKSLSCVTQTAASEQGLGWNSKALALSERILSFLYPSRRTLLGLSPADFEHQTVWELIFVQVPNTPGVGFDPFYSSTPSYALLLQEPSSQLCLCPCL